MIKLQSQLEQQQSGFMEAKERLESLQFVLGGGWEYERGSFDRALDAKDIIWLRLPFHVVDGRIDADRADAEATIQWESPFVLKHVYNEGNDPEAEAQLMGGLIDQFQDPVDPDADVEPEWRDEGARVLAEAEAALNLPAHM